MQIGLGLSITAQLRFGSSLSLYAVNDFDPSLVFDFEQNYYRTGGEDSTLSSSVTHSASSNATMTDSDGNIKWRPHNLLSYSEDFSNSSWQRVNVNITSNNEIAPDGTQTADTVVFANTYGSSIIRKYVSTSASTYTFSFYAKASSAIQIGARAGTTTQNFTLSTEWQLFTISALVTSATNTIFEIRGGIVGGVTAQIWGSHVYRSDLGGMVDNPARGDSYVPTTGSAVYAPRVGHHIYNGDAWVNEGVLHESEARTNIVPYSSDMSNMAWIMQGLDTVVSRAGGESDPAGGTAAHKIVANTGNSEHRVYDLSLGNTGVRSVYAKAGTANYLSITSGTQASGYAVFNLSSGEIESQANIDTAFIENVGNGWYRCSIIGGVNSTNIVFNVGTTATNVLPQTSWTGAGEYFYLWGAQAELGSTPSSYIPTSGSTVTRAAETLTVPAANMPYPETVYASGELVTNGTFDTDSNWTKGTGWTISGGIATAEGGVSDVNTLEQDIGLVQGKLYYYSFDVGGTVSGSNNLFLRFGANVNSLNITSSGTKSGILVAAGSGNLIFRSDAETADITLDNISFKEINPLSVSIQMDGRMTYADNSTTTANSDVGGEVTFFRWRLSNSDWLGSMINAKSPKVGQVNFRQKYSGAVDFTQTAEDYYNYANSPVSFNIASRHGSTFINGATDGTALTANTTPTGLPDLSATNLHLGYRFMGTIGKFRMWSEDLTDTGIATASAPTFTDEFAMTVTTTTANETFTIPCQNVGTFDAGIEWGDGSVSSISAYNDANLTHTYATAGDHLIRIRGSFPSIKFSNGGDKLKVKSVENLGTVGWVIFNEAFWGCRNMTSFTAGTTDTSSVTNMRSMFRDCTSLASLDVSSFDTSSNTDMHYMFYDCSSLTSLDVSSFDTSLVTAMDSTFRSCTNLPSLDVSGFDTSSVTNMNSMFLFCYDLTSINVSNFDTSSVTNMGRMFRDCRDILSLDLSNFNTSLVNTMGEMFQSCNNLTDIVGVENFDIEGLNSTNDLNTFISGGSIPTSRYDALLVNWDAQEPFDGMSPNFGNSTYTAGSAAATARANLISNDGWTITDGGTA